MDRATLLVEFASAGRRLGAGAVAGRVALLVGTARALAPAELVEVVDELWRTGDNAERAAVLAALAQLPAPERFLPLAVAACRSHVTPVFEAIACDNPYPAAHFPEAAWNQLVVKALFIDVPIDRIAGLAARMNPELARMAAAYAAERRAAGRPVSADTSRLATWSPSP